MALIIYGNLMLNTHTQNGKTCCSGIIIMKSTLQINLDLKRKKEIVSFLLVLLQYKI